MLWQWHELLLPFVGVKNLHIGSSIALRLARALELEAGGLVLPELQVLQVENYLSQNVFSSFIKTRRLMGHPVRLWATILPPLRLRIPAIPSLLEPCCVEGARGEDERVVRNVKTGRLDRSA